MTFRAWSAASRSSLPEVLPERLGMLCVHGRNRQSGSNKDPQGDGVKLKPFSVSPKRATLLNTGRPVDFVVNLTPADHLERKAGLRLMHLPVNELANTVLVVKLEFDRPLEELVQPTANPDTVTDWQR